MLRLTLPPDLEVAEGVGVDLSGSMFIPDLSVVVAEVAVAGVTLFKPSDVRLVVEIVSPSSVSMDRLLKPARYAEAGIPSYWRVEPVRGGGAPSIRVYDLDGDKYAETVTARPGGQVEVHRPFPVVLDPERLLI